MIARFVDERSVIRSRGYDPYNSADMPLVLAACNAKRARASIGGDVRRRAKLYLNRRYYKFASTR